MLRRKITLIFFLLTLLPLGILGIMVYERFSNTLEQNAVQSTQRVAIQIINNLDLLMSDLSRLSLSPLYDKSVLSILKKHSDSSKRFYRSAADNEKISMFLSALMYKRSELQGIHLISNDGNVFSHMDRNELRPWFDSNQENGWVDEVIKANGAAVILPAHTPTYYRFQHQDQHFGIGRLVRDPNTYTPLGIMKIDVKMEYMQELLSSIAGALVRVEDAQGRLIYEEGSLAEVFDRAAVELDTPQWLYDQDKKYLAIKHTSAESGLSILCLIPEDDILQESKQLGMVTLGFMLVSSMIAFGLSVVSSKQVVRPIEELKMSMERVQHGRLDERINIRRKDEIGKLAEGFNNMIEEINRLINEIYEKGLREKEAEFKALQSQINPHFIYNTLESINMLALEKDNYQISDMVTGLGHLLRYSTDHRKKMVQIREEVAVLKSYIFIMQTRLGERLEVEWDVDEEALDFLIPKLSLQPVVENAIIHGISSLEEGGRVWISIIKEDNCIRCTIKDNGAGMPDKQVKAITSNLARVDNNVQTRDSIGLWNIHRRIVLLYGRRYGLTIQSQMGLGTSVVITIPTMKEESN
ncbi:two-component system sensor histidine kinase YesM [Caldalkalibacillus uzonensis]|uniref:Two-component system sensor histidine kinase YesM n=1 Tax=Caldalkalibacillus uzonensis TaxID=353224 RepID=A0ABU0CXJ1_9BACI|nr:sensor histidine kinase [Caldalkalibacillus uzonensis]MDQ0340560.1 two-component system sensor histidine kinase YesM [Caldalkalibacillus uzonensis]